MCKTCQRFVCRSTRWKTDQAGQPGLGLWVYLISVLYTHKDGLGLRGKNFLRIPGRSCAALAAEASVRGASQASIPENEWMMVGSPASFEHLMSQQATDENLGLWLQSLVLSVPGNQELQN
eukprot:3226630-Amphidinium_carterae.1